MVKSIHHAIFKKKGVNISQINSNINKVEQKLVQQKTIAGLAVGNLKSFVSHHTSDPSKMSNHRQVSHKKPKRKLNFHKK